MGAQRQEEMSFPHAISIAESISSELSTIEQQQKALKRINELLVKAHEADRLLKNLDAEIAIRKRSLEELEPMLNAESAKAQQAHNALLANLRSQAETATAKLHEAEDKLKAADMKMEQQSREHDRRKAIMDKDIEDREKHLRKLEEDFAAFKQSHNL